MGELTVASVASALHLLNLLAENPGVGLSELARRGGLTKSRTYRLLCTLEQQFYVQRGGEPVTWRLGHQLLALGVNARKQIRLADIAEPVLDALSQRLNENLQIRLREGMEVVQIAVRPSRQALQVRSAVGNRRPLGAGASGKLLLAWAPDEIRAAFLAQAADPGLEASLSQIRRQQFACSQGELTAGVWAFAAPIFDHRNLCVASLSLSAPASRAAGDPQEAIIQALQQAAAHISRQLGSPAYGAQPLSAWPALPMPEKVTPYD